MMRNVRHVHVGAANAAEHYSDKYRGVRAQQWVCVLGLRGVFKRFKYIHSPDSPFWDIL